MPLPLSGQGSGAPEANSPSVQACPNKLRDHIPVAVVFGRTAKQAGATAATDGGQPRHSKQASQRCLHCTAPTPVARTMQGAVLSARRWLRRGVGRAGAKPRTAARAVTAWLAMALSNPG